MVLLVLAACSGGGNDAGKAAPTAAPSATSAPPVTTDAAPGSGGSATTASTVAPAGTDATTTTAAPGVLPGLAPLTLLTAGEGLGIRPILQWNAVDGAAQYVVVVNTPEGGPYWTWQGADTQVAFGGGPIDDQDTIGARLISPKRWFVVALDEAGSPIAASDSVALGP
jgi:hypothetical protein